MKTALVCGAGGFIGGHLVSYLKDQGYWVRGVDIKQPEFALSAADEFLQLDLRQEINCQTAVSLAGNPADEVYQLAAEMGGMGYIHSAPCEIMHSSALINLHMIEAAAQAGVERYFFSSSVCVYRDMRHGEPALTEADAYPAKPDNDYGWEKLYAERLIEAYGKKYDIPVRIARFQNCYGPYGTWRGGREKSPAAFCRKVAEAQPGGEIEMWGDGKAEREFIYVEDLVTGIYALMQSDEERPTNIGTGDIVTVRELLAAVAAVAKKDIRVKSIPGPVGVASRNFSLDRIHATGWSWRFTLAEGLAKTYPWIEEQVNG